jgi:hypothetical protein
MQLSSFCYRKIRNKKSQQKFATKNCTISNNRLNINIISYAVDEEPAITVQLECSEKKHKGYKLYLINLLWKILEAETEFLAHMENLSLASIGPELDGKFHVFLRDPENHSNTPLYSAMSQLNPGNIFTTSVFKNRLDDDIPFYVWLSHVVRTFHVF